MTEGASTLIDGLSIVIPTHGRADLVIALLESIAADAETTRFPVEVILVDDTPMPDGASIRETASRYGARVLSGQRPVGAKRNLGVQEARYSLILFLDSDVRVKKGTLLAHVNRLTDRSAGVVGCLGKVEFVGRSTFPWEVIKAAQLTVPFECPDFMDRVPWGPTANFSIRRNIFLELGGFDTTLPRGPGGEDVDLGFRLTKLRLEIATEPNAVAEHAIETWSTWRQNLSRLWSYGLADPQLFIRHPARAFLDLPTAPMLWIIEIVTGGMLIIADKTTVAAASWSMVVSVAAYFPTHAVLRRDGASRTIAYVFSPLVFWSMDLAKAAEAIRSRHPALVFKRLRYFDNLITMEWQEIAANAWGLMASAITYSITMLALSL